MLSSSLLRFLVNALTRNFLVKALTGTSLLRLNKDSLLSLNKGSPVKGSTRNFLVTDLTRKLLINILQLKEQVLLWIHKGLKSVPERSKGFPRASKKLLRTLQEL